MKRFIIQFGKIGSWLLLTICAISICLYFAGMPIKAVAQAAPPSKVTFYGAATSSISSAVAVPEDQSYYWTSGTVPPAVNLDAPPRTRDRYGDTKTQAIGILERFKGLLEEVGLTLADVVYLRAYLVADPALDNQVDYQGWFDAYAQYFNNPDNSTKVARSTVAVAGLVDPGWLIEIEAVAVYPKSGH
jgi:enamine deaminase RidA (YjgF/YER057c/UK114 family)